MVSSAPDERERHNKSDDAAPELDANVTSSLFALYHARPIEGRAVRFSQFNSL
jgi:hypothetical protein